MEESDADQVARARAGDQAAFRHLVERHSVMVFRLAYRITSNESDAEDVVQEAFLKAYRRLEQFESRANFGSWLYRIAANCAYDVLRARPRIPDQPLDTGDDEPAFQLPATDPSPDRLVFSGQVGARVERALSRLSAMERSAFVMRHYEGLSIEEIGQALGVEINATKSTIFRAVRKIREALQPMVSA